MCFLLDGSLSSCMAENTILEIPVLYNRQLPNTLRPASLFELVFILLGQISSFTIWICNATLTEWQTERMHLVGLV